MLLIDTPDLVETLSDPRLLAPEHLQELTEHILPLCSDLRILAPELVYRGWFTSYQMRQIARGLASNLILGSYTLEEPLGHGGMGHVYRALNWKLNKRVALKVIRQESQHRTTAATRFRREIRALGQINHPNIVLAYDADYSRGSMFFAMEYVRGTDLECLVYRDGPLSIRDACDYVLQAATGLQYAHERGLIHRDVKPSNLLVTDATRVVKVLDLGLTRAEIPIEDSVFGNLTQVGILVGTPDFMSPEQIRDPRGVDPRADLYALGCTFFFLLTGETPFGSAPSMVDKLFCQCYNLPPSVRSIRPDVPEEVAAVVDKLLAKRRQDRYQSGADLIEELKELLQPLPVPTMAETLLDIEALTSRNLPILQPKERLEATAIFPCPELQLVVSPEEPPPRRPRLLYHLPAIFLALVALLLVYFFSARSERGMSEPPPLPLVTPDP